MLLPGERIDDLQRKGLRIIQNPAAFRFGTDAVLLSSFVNLRKNDRVCDLGTGSGIIPLLLHARCPTAVLTGIELQSGMADMARRSVCLNGLDSVITILRMDIKQAAEQLTPACFDAVTCNPPYGKRGALKESAKLSERIARHEICVTLEECVDAACRLTRNGGRVYFIHQADRMLELMGLMQARHTEPKRVRMVHPRREKPPNLCLVEGIKLGRPGLKWLPPLFVFGCDHRYSDEINRIYHRQE